MEKRITGIGVSPLYPVISDIGFPAGIHILLSIVDSGLPPNLFDTLSLYNSATHEYPKYGFCIS